MSVYNGEKYLEEAIESILSQTLRYFEFVIVNDGSTDGTAAILRHYQQMDDRIQIYEQENRGLIASLNRGCELAKGEYIARMDADDVSLPERLAKQVGYMEAHPEVGVVGSWVEDINEAGTVLREQHYPTTPGRMGWWLIFSCCLAHPSIMMRLAVIRQLGFYCPEALHAEDYDVWARAMRVTRLANIPEVLLRYRMWQGGICSRHFQTQHETTTKVIHLMIQSLLGSEVSLEVVVSLRKGLMRQPLDSIQKVEEVTRLVHRLYRAYVASTRLSSDEASDIRDDVGAKLLCVASSASKISLYRGLLIYVQALRFNPRLLSPVLVLHGLRRVTRKALGRLDM